MPSYKSLKQLYVCLCIQIMLTNANNIYGKVNQYNYECPKQSVTEQQTITDSENAIKINNWTQIL